MTLIKMTLKSLKIKNESYYFWDDMVYLDKFDVDSAKINKRELRINADVYNISYEVHKPQYNIISVNRLYLIVKDLLGRVEKIKGSEDKYLVVDESNKKFMNVFNELFKFIEGKIKSDRDSAVSFGGDVKIIGYNKLKFSSHVDLPLDTMIKFYSLVVVVNCEVFKGNKLYPEVYLDEGIFGLMRSSCTVV